MAQKIRLSGIIDESIVDGLGIRLTVFTQGCPHHCYGCHNPQTHDFDGGYEEEISVIIEKVKSNPLLKGITLSGGEPFVQTEPLINLCKEVKKLGKDIWAFSGYTYEQLLSNVKSGAKELLENVDVLVDGKFIMEKRDLTLSFRGSSNQRIIDVKKSLAMGKVILLEF